VGTWLSDILTRRVCPNNCLLLDGPNCVIHGQGGFLTQIGFMCLRLDCVLVARLVTEAVLFVHLLWCGWVLLGWTLTRGRPILRALHIASLLYAIVIELVPWPPCPLTVAETWLEARAGIEPARGPFLARVLDAIVYPNLPTWVVVGGAVLVCVGILVVYIRRYLHRSASGEW